MSRSLSRGNEIIVARPQLQGRQISLSRTIKLILTLSPKHAHRFLVKLEDVGIYEGKNTDHVRFGTEQRLILLQEGHVFPNLTVSVEYRLETIRPRACSLLSITCQYDFTNASNLKETRMLCNRFEMLGGSCTKKKRRKKYYLQNELQRAPHKGNEDVGVPKDLYHFSELVHRFKK